jgi:O-antigen/teichoic acid export membrane protein
LLFNVVTKLTTPIIGVVVARQLGPEVMGTYMVLVTLMTFADLFRDAGVSRVYINDQNLTDRIERGYAAVAAMLGLALGVLMALTSGLVGGLFNSPLLTGGMLFGAAAVLLNGISTVPQAKLLRQGRLKESGLAETLGSVLSSIYALVLVGMGFGFWALASQLVVRSIIFLGVTWRLAPVGIFGGDLSLVRRIAGVSGALTGVNILWVGFSVGDQAVVGKMLGLMAGGFYGTGKMIVATADVIAKPLSQTVMVAFAHRIDDPALVARTLYKSLLVFVVAIVPTYVCVAALADPLVTVLLGERFAGTIPLLPALCVYGAVTYLGSFAGSALLVAGRPQVALYGWLVTFSVTFILIAAFWGSWSLTELAWLFTGALVLVNCSTLFFACRHYPANHETAPKFVRALLSAGVTAATAWLLSQLNVAPSIVLLLSLVLLPVIHLGSLGTFFGLKHSRMLSVGGIRELWQKL